MTNLECADALRRLADIIAANPKMSNPFSRGANTLCISCFDAEEFAATVRAFRRGTKEDNLANESIDFTPDFPIPVKVFGHKRWMCQMRPVTRVVPRQVIPAEPAREERIIDEHPETVMEYDCHPILAGLLSNGEPEMATVADVAEALVMALARGEEGDLMPTDTRAADELKASAKDEARDVLAALAGEVD